MFNLNRETGAITLPQGDTAQFRVRLTGGELPEGAVAVFGVSTSGSRGKRLLTKAFDVAGNEVLVRLTNGDTRGLAVGTHQWDLRVVTDPNRAPDGAVIAPDDGDNVYSIFSGVREMPQFIVKAVAADV